MTASGHEQSSTPANRQWFTTTHWSVVLAAGNNASAFANEALEHLCQCYWYPLYAYVRRRGYNPEDAQDLTQEFFARLLEKHSLADVDRAKGKFRSFLLASLNHFLANEWDRANAAKRGGGQPLISWDEEDAEIKYARESAPDHSPEQIFERQWALAVMERGLARLRSEFAASGKQRQFELLETFLATETSDGAYDPVAARLDVPVGTVGVMVYRMRQRYRDLVRAELANTVANPADLADEMRALLGALS